MLYWQELGPSLIKKCRLTSIWIPTLKIKPSYLKHGNRHTWKRRSLYWNRALVSSISICPMDAAFKRLPLLWRHDGRDGVSNHQLRDCLLNQRKSPALLAFVREIHRWPANWDFHGEQELWNFDEVKTKVVWCTVGCGVVCDGGCGGGSGGVVWWWRC